MTNESEHLQRFMADGNIELRCIDKTSPLAERNGGHVIWSSVFDYYPSLRQAILFAENKGWDIYHTINPVKHVATNAKLRPFIRTTRDTDIDRITTIFFDFDAIREKGVPATDEQVDLCLDQANEVIDFLEGYDWCIPTFGWSGNGVHLHYRTDMSVVSLAGLYAGLGTRFTTDDVSFDITVKNPSRISRCLGTTNHKSGRRSRCMFYDNIVSSELVTKTLQAITPPKPKRTWVKPSEPSVTGNSHKVDVVALFQKYGLYLQQTQEPGKHFVICPWENEHGETGSTDTVIWEQEYPTFHCSHSHCDGRGMSEVVGLLG